MRAAPTRSRALLAHLTDHAGRRCRLAIAELSAGDFSKADGELLADFSEITTLRSGPPQPVCSKQLSRRFGTAWQGAGLAGIWQPALADTTGAGRPDLGSR